MDAQRLIVMAVIGIVAGWLASFFVGGLRAGLVGYLVAGLIGSIVGGWLLGQLGLRFSAGNAIVDSIITSTIGAVVVIVLARLLGI
jgi:uncharacterized membrane protein YeaQ/YmgE (transglycosylase-associated protein family)